jgi:hypothetical protein
MTAIRRPEGTDEVTGKMHTKSGENRHSQSTRQIMASNILLLRKNYDPGRSRMVEHWRAVATDAESHERRESSENAAEIGNELDGAESSRRRVIDTIPAMAWCARPDGSMEIS